MDTTGWYLKDTAHPEHVLHAHPTVIVATETEAMDKKVSQWHYANIQHPDATIHAYYNSFNPDSTRWADKNKGNAYRHIVANMTPAQRKQVILNAQASHNNGSATPPDNDGYNAPLPPESETELPAAPAMPFPVTPPAAPSNGSPSGTQLDALTALIEEQAKMSALGLRANVETRQSLNGHIASTDTSLVDLRSSLADATAAMQDYERRLIVQAAELTSLKESRPQETIITIKRPDREPVKIEGMRHSVFPKLLEYVEAITAGRRGIWLTGGAGTGKTTLASHVAEATGRQFRLQGAVTAKHDLLGYMDAYGKYVSTPFRDAYEHGHLMLLDEVDASFPAGTLAIQAAISNKMCQFPDQVEPVVMHENFIIFCAANTTGQGADALYSGRTKQDAAFLDRFLKIHVDYDENWERSITPTSLQAWTRAVQEVRHNVSSAATPNRSGTPGTGGASAQIIISVRSIFFGIDLLSGTNISAVTIVDDIFRSCYGHINTFDTLFAPVYAFAREFDRQNKRG